MEDKLVKLVHLVNAGSFTKAAKAMYISQPALSMSIHQLESQLGKKLILRNGRSFTLTTHGEAAYIAGKKILASTEALSRHINAKKQKPRLKIGLIDSIASQLFKDASTYDELMRLSEATVMVNNTDRLLADLEKDKLDYVVASKTNNFNPKLVQAAHLAHEKLVCVVADSTYEKLRKSIAAQKLPQFIAYNEGSNTYKQVASSLKKYGITAEVIFHSTSPEIMRQLVVDGKGCAFLPLNDVKNDITSGVLKSIPMVDVRVTRDIYEYSSSFSSNSSAVESIRKRVLSFLT